MVLDKETVEMMVNEYEYDPAYNQENSLYENLVKMARSHEDLRRGLIQAVKYLIEGKAKYAPNTTNSFVDDFIKKYRSLD